MNRDGEQLQAKRAALYVRMSTEHQQYSTSNQMDVILANMPNAAGWRS